MSKLKYILLLSSIFLSPLFLAQNVVLNKVVKTHPNSDKIFYKINPELDGGELLGEVEIQGFSNNNVEIFNKIYTKAKEIGANAFCYLPVENVDGTVSKLDPMHYKLGLYYLNAADFPKEDNTVYLIGSPYKDHKISINNKIVTIPAHSYSKLILEKGQLYTISTRKLLGSSIKLAAQENHPVTYFQVSGFSVNSNEIGKAGINLKSGDIIRLERSYAQFLTTIYEEIK